MFTKNQSITGHQIREQNLLTLRRTLHKEQVATISELKNITGLSVVTINKLISGLVETGEVIPGGLVSTAGGRPAATYRYNPTHKLLLIISCFQRAGNDYACYSVHDLFGDCIERREELILNIHTDEFRIGIERYLDLYSKIAIIGISMPSDTIGGRVASALRHDPRSKRLAQHLEKRFNVPVFFETDINAATLGCHARYPNHHYVSGVVLVPGRAPACGFCYQGSLLRGKDGMAGEIRYFPMYKEFGVLPVDPIQADELAQRTIRAVMCVLNPSLMVVYTETLKSGIAERMKKKFSTEAEAAFMPKIEINSKIRDDIVNGMVILCLEKLSKI